MDLYLEKIIMKPLFGILKKIVLIFIVTVLISCGGPEERKAKYLEKGKVFLKSGNLDKARIELKNVIQIDPKSAEAYYYLGRLEEKNKEILKAMGFYTKAVDLDPTYVDAKIKIAKIYVIAGTDEFLGRAQVMLDDVFTIEPDNAEATLVRATIDYKAGKKDEAIKVIEKVVKENKAFVEGVSLLASIYAKEGNIDRSISVLREGVDNSPSEPLIRLALAKLYTKNNNIDEAEKELLKVIELKPDVYPYTVALSGFYSTTNQLVKAEKVLRDAVRLDESNAQKQLVLVEFIAARKSRKEAERELLDAISNNPKVFGLKFALAEFYRKSGDVENVKKVLREIIDKKSYEAEGFKSRILLAGFFYDEQNIFESKKLIDEVLKEHPNDNEALLIGSKISMKGGDALSAINGLRTVLKNDPKNSEASKLLARAYEMNKESDLANDILKNAIAINPIDYKTHVNYAEYLYYKNKADESAKIIDKALVYFKDSYELLDFKLRLVAASKNKTEVFKVLAEMKLAAPDNGLVYLKSGQLYMAEKDYAKAINDYEKALTLMNDKYQPLSLIVQAYMAQKWSDKAVERLNDFIKDNKKNPVPYVVLGKLYSEINELGKSRDSFILAVEYGPSWPAPYMGLASVYILTDNYEKAINVYKDAIKNISNSASIKLQLATVYEKSKQFDNAMGVYEELLISDPANKLAANNLASLLIEYKLEASSIERAKQLVMDFDSIRQPAFRDTMGWVYVKSGDFEKAVTILKEVVASDPRVAIFKYHLGVALYNSGDKQAAKKYLEEAIASKQEFLGKDDAIKLLSEI